MLKIGRAGFFVILLAAALYAGGDPWKSKPYTQWDEKDVAAVLQTSPWVKVNVPGPESLKTSAAAPENPAAMGAAGGMTGHGNPATATVPTQLGGNEKVDADAVTKSYNVYWWSSRTIRAAFARRAVLKGGMTQDKADKLVAANPDSYQILVNSSNMANFENRDEDAFKDAAFLELKKEKRKIDPTAVAFQRSSGKVVGVLFSFPRKDANGEVTIPPEEREIEFNLRISDAWLRTAFNLKQMTDMQGQDL
jgi:hypothetical protein